MHLLLISDSIFGASLAEQFQPSAETVAPPVLIRTTEELEKRVQETGRLIAFQLCA